MNKKNQGAAFIVLGALLVVVASGTFLVRAAGIVFGLWLVNHGCLLMGKPPLMMQLMSAMSGMK